jgi:aminopeptidase N
MINKIFAIAALLITESQSIGNSRDSSSYANIDEVITEHISLNFAVDFDTKTFDGHVTLNMKTIADQVESVFLDSAGLDVHEVQYKRIHDGQSSW